MATDHVLSEHELTDIKIAKSLLEYPGLTARIANLLGKPITAGFGVLPPEWRDRVSEATRTALLKGLDFSLNTMGARRSRRSKDRLHKLMVAGTGAIGGTFGLPALPIELPISTCIILRSIADIARSEGHNVTDLPVKLSCLEVLALGGTSEADDSAESGYWAVRVALARALSEAATFIAERGVAEEGAPALVRLVATIASRFGVLVSEEIAAKAVPVIGAMSGAAINYAFMDHFQDMARGHFIIKRLENKYGFDFVQRQYVAVNV